MASKGEKFGKTVEVLGPVNPKVKKGGDRFVKVKVIRVVSQGKVNKDGSNTRTGNKIVVTTEKRRLVEYVTKKDKNHVSVLAKIKKRSASGNFLIGIKKIAQCYNQRHGLKKGQAHLPIHSSCRHCRAHRQHPGWCAGTFGWQLSSGTGSCRPSPRS